MKKYIKSTSKLRQKYEKVSEKCNKVGEKYIVVKKSELSAVGTKRDVENTPKFTRLNCIGCLVPFLPPNDHFEIRMSL